MNKITLDVRMINNSGIGTYIRNLVPRIISSLPEVNFCLLGNTNITNPIFNFKNTSMINCTSSIYSVSEQIELLRKIPKDTTLLWTPHYNIPLLYKGKTLVTVHDVFHLALPQYVGGLHKRLYAKGMFAAVTSKADQIICVSEFTANELVHFTGMKRESIQVIHNGVDQTWFNIEKGQPVHPKPYLLYVGNVKPYKNLTALIQAFERVVDHIPHDLIIVGKKEGFITGDPAIVERAERLNKRVIFTGYVDDELLKQYFAYATALVFPSLYEGFGLPPLEAMACGCPVIASTAASIPEVCGEAALYCDPTRPEDIADKIQQLLNNTSLMENLKTKSRERAHKFTWEQCAKETVKVIEEVLAK